VDLRFYGSVFLPHFLVQSQNTNLRRTSEVRRKYISEDVL